jgi:(p)ppGpp synthase/HD superfamily hydrolase
MTAEVEEIGGVYASSPVVGEAYRLAAAAHSRDGVKDFKHPLSVARKLADNSYDEEVIAAALLHDTVEDHALSLGDVQETFGTRICALVDALTEDGTIEPWEARKDAHRTQVSTAGEEAAAIYAADKLAGSAGLRRAYAEQGEAAAEGLTAPTLDARIRAWDADLGMLERVEPRISFLPELRTELAAIKAERQAAAAPNG